MQGGFLFFCMQGFVSLQKTKGKNGTFIKKMGKMYKTGGKTYRKRQMK